MTPQQLKAMKLALEALEEINKLSVGENAIFLPAEIDTAMDAIKEALAQPEQEPVAIERMKEWIEYLKYLKRTSDQHMKIPSEMSAGTCWELALELEQFINTTPPQRTWVGLTRAERFEIEKAMSKYYDYQHECKTVCLPEFAAAIEAKLKEKNGV